MDLQASLGSLLGVSYMLHSKTLRVLAAHDLWLLCQVPGAAAGPGKQEAGVAACGGRGALHQLLGPRLPPQLPPPGGWQPVPLPKYDLLAGHGKRDASLQGCFTPGSVNAVRIHLLVSTLFLLLEPCWTIVCWRLPSAGCLCLSSADWSHCAGICTPLPARRPSPGSHCHSSAEGGADHADCCLTARCQAVCSASSMLLN